MLGVQAKNDTSRYTAVCSTITIREGGVTDDDLRNETTQNQKDNKTTHTKYEQNKSNASI